MWITVLYSSICNCFPDISRLSFIDRPSYGSTRNPFNISNILCHKKKQVGQEEGNQKENNGEEVSIHTDRKAQLLENCKKGEIGQGKFRVPGNRDSRRA